MGTFLFGTFCPIWDRSCIFWNSPKKGILKKIGDRAEKCHGDLEPVSMEIDGKKGYVIVFKCKKCGEIRRNKAAKDDNMDLLIDLSSKQI